MSCIVKRQQSGRLAFRLFWDGIRSWEGTKLKDTAKNRQKLEAKAVLISEEMEEGTFDYLRWFPEGSKAHIFRPAPAPERERVEASTVAGYYAGWIAKKTTALHRPSLIRDYRQHFRAYILPGLGDMRLDAITPRVLENFRFGLLNDRKLSVKTCRNVIDGTLRAMFREARDMDELVSGDPFAQLPWPRRERKPPDPYTEEERDAILRYFQRKVLYYYPFVLTRFWTGMRPSEATALRWGDVDLQAGYLRVTKSRHLGAENAPKTRGSDRNVKLLPNVVEALKAIKPLRCTEIDHVFVNTEGNPLDQDEWRRLHWHKALRALGLRPRPFYNTRHTYISVALTQGVKPQWIAEQCGTSVTMIYEHYGRYIRDDGDAALRALFKPQGARNSARVEEMAANYAERLASPTGFEPVLPA